jgi:hypothetical protein
VLNLNDQVSSPSKPSSGFLPFLTVLFLVSYGLLTLLVVEQGRTIDNQRFLIQQLFSDSTQLSAMRGKAFRKQYDAEHKKDSAKVQGQAAAPQARNTPSPSAQGNSGSEQNTARHVGKPRKDARPVRPQQPPSDLTDERRVQVVI